MPIRNSHAIMRNCSRFFSDERRYWSGGTCGSFHVGLGPWELSTGFRQSRNKRSPAKMSCNLLKQNAKETYTEIALPPINC